MVTDITAYEMAERKLNDIWRQIVLIRQQKTEIEEAEKKLLDLLASWHRIYESEKPIPGPEPEPPTVEAVQEELVDGWVKDPKTDIYEISTQPTPRSYGDKTDVLKDFLEAAGRNGLLPKEAKALLILKGVKVSKSFANNAFFRLKKDGQVIVLADGRYALTKFYEESQDQQQTPP